MADRVELAFRRAALELIPGGSRVLAAVSGGGDSVALLHLLVGHARRRDVAVSVAHLDHGLRRGSGSDRRFVAGLAAELSLEAVTERREVARLRRRGESLEEAARRVRRDFLIRAGRQVRADLVATGHTLDDQAETVLMRLVRGAGPSALAGIASRGPGPFVRPLLGVSRADVRAYLGRRELAFREDPSNRDLRFDRNRTRHRVLPVLAEALNPRAAEHLVRAARRLRDDALYLDEIAREAYGGVSAGRRGQSPSLTAKALASLPAPLARRVVRLALADAGVDLRRVAERHIEAVVDLALGAAGRRVHLPGRREAARARDRVVFR